MSKRRPSLHPDLWLRHMQVLHAMIQMGVLVPTTGDMIAARDGQHSSSLTGEDLLAIAADQPFQFPATFTFVRAFSVLDGINLERALTLDLILLRLPNREFDLCFFQL
ncbi:protein ACTIVITY OF BC1 COMPLEX KINASE 8, chloroplastic-like isoform X4 [Carya illinoinensis]|uniref:protein ACTIVITY OF BC1 COMPLEX KINASE 8, chloroplastic-like isoform X4 n=1 Tax=Carya illinoinensis TaxID=32201 RepID=UPI001C71E01C|nr:protein ACTIVITY OF BC1 COMPLEX KINASE 8, chloroplastic-like isoform X4 [Carya illinoinensis]